MGLLFTHASLPALSPARSSAPLLPSGFPPDRSPCGHVRFPVRCDRPPTVRLNRSRRAVHRASLVLCQEMPQKSTGEAYHWDQAKELAFLQKLDYYVACNSGKHPPLSTLDAWAQEFNAAFGGVPAYGLTLQQKKDRMKKIYRGWKYLQSRTGLGYDPVTDRVICSDETWQSFLQGHKECNQLRYEGLRNKELFYNIFDRKHSAGASAYASVSMADVSRPSVDLDASQENSEIGPVPGDDLTPPVGRMRGRRRRAGAAAGPVQSRASSGKRKQREETEEMTFLAMQEIFSHYRGRSESGTSNSQSSRTDHMLLCMSAMTEMGVPPNQRTIMWHYFSSRPQLQRTFHQLPEVDRHEIVASVVHAPQPPTT